MLTTLTVADDDGEAAVPRRVRITMKDLKRYGFTGGCPRCADLELGRARSTKNHNEECRSRLYKKFQEETHEKSAKVRAERDRTSGNGDSTAPEFVNLDAADSDKYGIC